MNIFLAFFLERIHRSSGDRSTSKEDVCRVRQHLPDSLKNVTWEFENVHLYFLPLFSFCWYFGTRKMKSLKPPGDFFHLSKYVYFTLYVEIRGNRQIVVQFRMAKQL